MNKETKEQSDQVEGNWAGYEMKLAKQKEQKLKSNYIFMRNEQKQEKHEEKDQKMKKKQMKQSVGYKTVDFMRR